MLSALNQLAGGRKGDSLLISIRGDRKIAPKGGLVWFWSLCPGVCQHHPRQQTQIYHAKDGQPNEPATSVSPPHFQHQPPATAILQHLTSPCHIKVEIQKKRCDHFIRRNQTTPPFLLGPCNTSPVHLQHTSRQECPFSLPLP